MSCIRLHCALYERIVRTGSGGTRNEDFLSKKAVFRFSPRSGVAIAIGQLWNPFHNSSPAIGTQHHHAWLGETENGNLRVTGPLPCRPDANVGNFHTGKQRGSLMIHRSGNPFMESQKRRCPMRLNSCGGRQVFQRGPLPSGSPDCPVR